MHIVLGICFLLIAGLKPLQLQRPKATSCLPVVTQKCCGMRLGSTAKAEMSAKGRKRNLWRATRFSLLSHEQTSKETTCVNYATQTKAESIAMRGNHCLKTNRSSSTK